MTPLTDVIVKAVSGNLPDILETPIFSVNVSEIVPAEDVRIAPVWLRVLFPIDPLAVKVTAFALTPSTRTTC